MPPLTELRNVAARIPGGGGAFSVGITKSEMSDIWDHWASGHKSSIPVEEPVSGII